MGSIIHIAPDFWNIRGSFKIAGLLDVGTQVSLVRRANGKFVFLDSYTLSDEVEREVRSLTNGGADVEAILNVHPFHTVHVRRMHERFPSAKLYGTARHIAKFPELPWEPLRTEDAALHEELAVDFDFPCPGASTSFRPTRTYTSHPFWSSTRPRRPFTSTTR